MQKKTCEYLNLSIWTWLKIILSIAILSGITSVIFLHTLNSITKTRENHTYLLLLLPLAGLLIIYLYKRFEPNAKHGINLLFEEYYNPQNKISWAMTPLIFIATLLTHLCGGSAGREGTSIQYGGTYGDRIGSIFKLNEDQQRITIIAGIAAGFASLFGTPLAGAIFAIEVMKIGKARFKALPIAILTAYCSYYVCLLLSAPHTTYTFIPVDRYFDIKNLWIIPIALACGLAALLYRLMGDYWTMLFNKIHNEYYRIVVGSILILSLVYLTNSTQFIGLGLPTIQSAFETPAGGYDFILKIIFTTLTLSIGFQGGEVTPLFFIGATLTSFLSTYIPLPMMVLVAIGYISTMSGATKTPLACSLMALELFGWSIFPVALLTSFIATWTTGLRGIYSAQRSTTRWI